MEYNGMFTSQIGAISRYRVGAHPNPVATFSEAAAAVTHPVLDPAGVIEFFYKNFLFCDRTLIQQIKRTPWMAAHAGNGEWTSIELPEHGRRQVSAREVADQLAVLLKNELAAFGEGRTSLGILLSGGMDSRVTAAALRSLQQEGRYSGTVTAVSWGRSDSRDVVYASRIAERFGWEHAVFPLNADVLRENIELAAVRGAEASPIHYHAMKAVSQLSGIDGVIAGSYGDSIGRGEYSGIHCEALPDILSKTYARFHFVTRAAKRAYFGQVRQDLAELRCRFPERTQSQLREIEMQAHYMRRQLNSCMAVIDEQIPLYQAFTSPEVVRLMWGLHPSSRNDQVYYRLLELLPGNLLEIPWARSGKRYLAGDSEQQADDLHSVHHAYGDWLKQELYPDIVHSIRSADLERFGVFNMATVEYWVKHYRHGSNSRSDALDERIAWLASFAKFVTRYGIEPPDVPRSWKIRDYLDLCASSMYGGLYRRTRALLGRI